MQQIAHHPSFGRSTTRGRGVERVGASAAVVRHASARQALGATADDITVVQHVARWCITMVVVALAAGAYAFEIHAMLR